MSLSDAISLLAIIVAFIVPRLLQTLDTHRNVIIIVCSMFACAIIAGIVSSLVTGVLFATIFTRVFMVSGIAHILVLVIYIEIYQRLQTRQLQLDAAQREIEQRSTSDTQKEVSS